MRKRHHPGIHLQEFLTEFNITPYRLAKDTFIPATRIHEILKGNRAITVDTAIRLSKYFGNSVEQWLNMQRAYDLSNAKPKNVDDIVPLSVAG
jgi:antitoxin HigA-1